MILAAVFALVWAVVRAAVQSMTIDEADTYVMFAGRSLRWVWFPAANNHVLNSLLIWIATLCFGTTSLTVRMPALVGAALYILTCYFLAREISDDFKLRLSLFLCLTFNPFIFDYLVAARGYSLAVALLLAAIAIPLWRGISLRRACILSSLALGLSFTANFSFLFVDFAAFLALVAWALGRRGSESRIRVIEFCVLPGLLAALLIAGYTLANWRPGELWWGAKSLSETARSLIEDSLYQLDPRFSHSGIYKAANLLKPFLLPVLAVLCICQLVVTRLEGSWLEDARARWLGRFAAGLAAIAALSLTVSWLAFRFYKLPLPMGRTAIYIVPLCTLVAGIIAAAPARSVVSRYLRRSITTLFICLACYFLLCLRLTYFKEWRWDADVKDVYSVLARYNHNTGVNNVEMTWWYVSSLNYYRMVSGAETFREFAPSDPPTGSASIYVLNSLFDRRFLEQHKLVEVYHGKSTDVVIAVRADGPIPTTRIDP